MFIPVILGLYTFEVYRFQKECYNGYNNTSNQIQYRHIV